MKALLRKIRQILKDRRTRRFLTRFVSGIAAVVVFVTTYALVLPAITMESEAACGIEAHQHDDSCYSENLICGQEESEGHHHTDDCYTVTRELECDLEEHQHSSENGCFDEEGNVVCKLEEHTHTDSCYKEHRELTCGLEESEGHHHTDSCYEKVLTCGKEVHTHSAACYKADLEVESSAVASTGMTSAAAKIEDDNAHAGSISSEADEISEVSEDLSSASDKSGRNDESVDANADHDAFDVGDKNDGDKNADDKNADSKNTDDSADNKNKKTDNHKDTDEDREEDASSFSTGFAADEDSENGDSYIPEKEELDFKAVLNRRTGIYYHHVAEDEDIEDSSVITDWTRVDEDTELDPKDLIRVYLSYTLPKDTINATNDISRYRLPDTLHLTDDQVEAINTCENGISAQYADYDNLEITDPERHAAYLGIESVEGTRRPGEEPEEDSPEYISATVRAEKIYDEETGEYEGTDLIFTFSPYAVEKNAHAYDKKGQPTRAGEEVTGWLTLDFNMGQIDWAEDSTSEIVFTEEDKISTVLKQADPADAETDDSAADGTTEAAAEYATEEAAAAASTAEIAAEGSTEAAAAETAAASAATTSETAAENSSEKTDADDKDDPGKEKEDEEKAAAVSYPAAVFDDSITVRSGRLDTDLADTDIPKKTKMTVHVEADEGTFPEGTKMVLSAVEDIDAVAEAVGTAIDAKTRGFQAVDITFYDKDPSEEDAKEIEPLKPIRVSIKSDEIRKAAEDSSTAPVVVHIEDDNTATEIENTASKTDSGTIEIEKPAADPESTGDPAPQPDAEQDKKQDNESEKGTDSHESTETDKSASPAVEAEAENETENSSADTDGSADKAGSTDMDGSTDRDGSADTDGSADKSASTDKAGSIDMDESTDTDGFTDKIEPTDAAESADTEETLDTAASSADTDGSTDTAGSADNISENEESADKAGTGDTVDFEADSFSVYAIVYTVDFHWEVDGKKYAFSIPGGGYVTLEQLVEVLGIAGNVNAEVSSDSSQTEKVLSLTGIEISEETKNLVAEVESVSFSDPKLLWTGKVSEDTSVGTLKQDNNLICAYSLDLSADDIVSINNEIVKSGDWAIISLEPFDTEESLTVTLKDGESFMVKVTDKAGDAIMNGDVVQTIANPNGTTIDLFDYWVDSSLENDTNYGQNDWPGNGTWYYYDRDNKVFVDNNTGFNLYGKGTDSGINAGHAFKFTPAQSGSVIDGTLNEKSIDATNKENPDGGVNSWTHGATPRVGIVENTLGSDNYPVTTVDDSIGTNGESLNYLFNHTDDPNSKKSYPGVNQLLYVDPDGYYTFDSNDYDATFNKGNSTFTVEEQTNAVGNARGFWPFGNQQYWLGMHMHVDFSMPANGQVLNPKGVYKDMEFEFQGDDDTWLYVDGILVGDGGGIHNQTLIRINFKQGKVLVSGEYDVKTDYKTSYHEEKYLDNLYIAAGKYNDYQWVQATDDEGNLLYHPVDPDDPRSGQPVMTFASGTDHKFDMFYLERGGGESNLRIHYNLVSTTDFSAHKSYHMPDNDPNGRLMRDQFKFELIGYDNPEYAGTEFQHAIMPDASVEGEGTVASPQKVWVEGNPGYYVLTTGVTEDGNVNFGNIQVQASQAGKWYKYMVREVVDPDAVNADGIAWKDATEEQKAEGGFVNSDGITYDGRVYYFIRTVVETEEGSGKYRLKTTRYTDETYSVEDKETRFNSFVNGHVEPITLKVLKKNNEQTKLLSGAQFSLVRAKHEVTTNEQGTVTSEKWIPRPNATVTTKTTENGTLSFTNLTEGHYILEETAPPQGYSRNATYRWLLVLTKEDSAESPGEIKLVPTLTPLNAQGTPTGNAEELDVGTNHVVEHTVLNGKLPRGPLTVQKKWLKADGETEYTAEELAELAGAEDVVITGKLQRTYTETSEGTQTVSAPRVTIKAKTIQNDNTEREIFSQTVQSESSVKIALGYNGTQDFVISNGDLNGASFDVDNSVSGNYITDDRGVLGGRSSYSRAYTISNITQDVTITVAARNSNNFNSNLSYRILEYTPGTTSQQTTTTTLEHIEIIKDPTTDQEVFSLNEDNDWKITWTSDDLNEQDYDYVYELIDVTESNKPQDFTFVENEEITTDSTTGEVTFTVKNIKEGEKTDLTVRKVWGDSVSHSGDTITYKIQRAEYNAEGGLVRAAYDYVETGQSAAQTYTLSSSDTYQNVSWQKHHDNLPANNGKEITDPAYVVYRYSVVEVNVPDNYTASYYTTNEAPAEGDPYEVKVIYNSPADARVSVEKKWMNNGKTAEITSGIPDGAYITGTLKRSYTWQEASGTTVRVYNRLWSGGYAQTPTLIGSYTVQNDTDFILWAYDSGRQYPNNGVTANGNTINRSTDISRTIYPDPNNQYWTVIMNPYVIHINGDTDIIMDWYYNSDFQNGWTYDVDFTEATGGGESHNETETVGNFRIDASNDWKWAWTDRELDQNHVYTYFFENVQEHKADGTVVANFDGFNAPEVGSLTQGADGRWTCSIINEQVNLKAGLIFKKVNIEDLNKENLTEDDLLEDAKFKLEKYISLRPDQKDVEWNNHNSTETAGDGNGTFTFTDLPAGYYKIIETAYPDGYCKVKEDPIIEIFKVDGENRLGVRQVDAGGTPITDTSEEIIRIVPNQTTNPTTIIVGNTPGAALPNAGGPGTNIFTLLGTMLLAFAVVGKIIMKRRQKISG